MIPDAIVDEVRARADIVEVVGEHISLKRAGKDFRALCPFHHEKTPSFYVVPAKGFYKCFGCGESGDVFSFLMKRSGYSFQDAVRELAAKVGVEIPADRRQDGEEPHQRLYEAVAFAAEFFQERLWDEAQGERGRKYLAGRSIGEEAAKRFGLGCAPDEWRGLREAAQRHGMTDEVLLEAGLVKESEHSEEPYDRFRDRLIFPIAELGGRVVGFGGRVLRPAENSPKYLNSPETPIYHKGEMLYGLNWSRGAIRREGAALVVEGFMDYVSLAARGLEHVVAGLGTAMTVEQANLVGRYCGKALLLYDSDQAGLRASFRTADALLRAGVHPLLVTLPQGEDPDSLARRSGAEALRPFLAAASDVVERKLAMLDERGSFHDVEGTRRALDRLLPTIRATVDPALRDIYISRVAERTGVRRETLEQQAAQVSAVESRTQSMPAARGRPRRALAHRPARDSFASERLLIKLLIRDPDRLPLALAALQGARLHDPRYRAIYQALAEGTPVAALETVLGGTAAEALQALRQEANEITDAEGTFNAIVADIRVPDLFVRVQYVNDRLDGGSGDVTLMREWQQLHAELGRLGAEGRLGPKTSRRYRSVLRAPEPERTPPESNE
jgi:DNA primase